MQELEQEKELVYEQDGYVQESVAAIIILIVGVGVGVLVLIFVGALGGQTYNLVEPDISAISDASIQANITDAIKSSFVALKQTGSYMPILVLAVIITVILGLIIGLTGGLGAGMMGGYGGGRYYGGAL